MMKDDPIHTVREAWSWSLGLLAKPPESSRRREIERLLAHVLKVPPHELYLSPDRPLGVHEADRFQTLWLERLGGRPLQYLLGETEFMSLRFLVEPGVFIPRPETERLVDAVIAHAGGAGVWIDVGTGAGGIAVSLAHYAPRTTVYATDASPEALRLARENARFHGVSGRVRFVRGDLLDPFRPTGWADGIVSNPPYVAAGEISGLPEEVRDYEPHAALLGGRDGLAVIRALARQAPGILKPRGYLALEIGETQARDVHSLFGQDPSWDGIEIEKDLAGRHRVAVAVRAGM